jgi:periplasmic copper chaperone A
MRVVVGLFWLAVTGAAHAAPAVAVSDGWARATLPHQDEGVAYLTLRSAAGDTLTGVDSPAAGMVMLHQTTQKNGVSSMEDVDSLALPPGKDVALAPGGTHLMLMDVKHALKAGDTLRLSLHFAKVGELDVSVPVLPVGATGPRQ